nr:HAD family hydrolase [Flexivirga meconopsidis]
MDVDGTLIDSTYLHALAWERAFESVQVYPQWWRVHHAIGMGGDRLVAHVAGDQVEAAHGDQLRKLWSREYAAVLEEVRPIDGAGDFVRSLQDAGLRVALASSGAPDFTEHAMELLGLGHDDVAAVTTSDDADSSKPAPDILQVALDRAGGGEAVVIGDSDWDAHAAGRLRAPCLGVRTGGFSSAELLDAGCVDVRDSVADLTPDQVTRLL